MKKILKLLKNRLFSSPFAQYLQEDEARKFPLITISRELGSYGSNIANDVALKLGPPWKIYHYQTISEIAAQPHHEKEIISQISKNKVPLMDEMLEDFRKNKAHGLEREEMQLMKIIIEIGTRGHAVILGRGANFLFPRALKLRIVSEMSARIKNVVKNQKVSEAESIKRIEETDRNRYEFVNKVFNHDLRKAHHYDLVIRTGQDMDIAEATSIITRVAKNRFNLPITV